eukprot:1340403-Amorphochlora_amoeboformis.AAC.3
MTFGKLGSGLIRIRARDRVGIGQGSTPNRMANLRVMDTKKRMVNAHRKAIQQREMAGPSRT